MDERGGEGMQEGAGIREAGTTAGTRSFRAAKLGSPRCEEAPRRHAEAIVLVLVNRFSELFSHRKGGEASPKVL